MKNITPKSILSLKVLLLIGSSLVSAAEKTPMLTDDVPKTETISAAIIDPAQVVSEVGKYPLKICPVSKEKLGGMGAPFVFKHEGREVRLCCKGCLKDFKAESEKYMAVLNAAVINQQKPSYPLQICIVHLDDLKPEETVDYVATNGVLFRLGCQPCVQELEANLEKYTKELERSRSKL
jgi:hypothetical protein